MRYIDPYQLAEKVAESMHNNPHEDKKIALNHRLEHEHFLRMIALEPDADVKPVIHGHWIYKPLEGDDIWLYHCSACANLSARPRAYCADCGAKMEIKVEHYDD